MGRGAGWANALAAGINGYVKGVQIKRGMDQDDEDRETRKQEQAQRREEAAIRLSQLKQTQNDQIALRQAAVPVLDTSGGVTRPEYADNIDVGQPDGPSLANGQLRPGLADQQNTPEGVRARQAATLQAQGRYAEDISLQNSQLQLTKGKEGLEEDRRKRAKLLIEEGAEETAKAMRTGDPIAVTSAWNKQGVFKVADGLKAIPEERDIPGVGRQTTYNFEGEMIGPNGQRTPFKRNSHDASMELFKYKDQLDYLRKGTEAESKAQLRLAQGDSTLARADAALAKVEAAIAKAAADKTGRENSGVREALSYLDGSRKELANEATEIRQTMKAELDVASSRQRQEIIARYQPKLDAIEQRRQELQSKYDRTATRVGLGDADPAPKPGKPTAAGAAPDPSKIQGLPKGAKVGAKTEKGWEVKDATGKLLGYVRD